MTRKSDYEVWLEGERADSERLITSLRPASVTEVLEAKLQYHLAEAKRILKEIRKHGNRDQEEE